MLCHFLVCSSHLCSMTLRNRTDALSEGAVIQSKPRFLSTYKVEAAAQAVGRGADAQIFVHRHCSGWFQSEL